MGQAWNVQASAHRSPRYGASEERLDSNCKDRMTRLTEATERKIIRHLGNSLITGAILIASLVSRALALRCSDMRHADLIDGY